MLLSFCAHSPCLSRQNRLDSVHAELKISPLPLSLSVPAGRFVPQPIRRVSPQPKEMSIKITPGSPLGDIEAPVGSWIECRCVCEFPFLFCILKIFWSALFYSSDVVEMASISCLSRLMNNFVLFHTEEKPSEILLFMRLCFFPCYACINPRSGTPEPHPLERTPIKAEETAAELIISAWAWSSVLTPLRG